MNCKYCGKEMSFFDECSFKTERTEKGNIKAIDGYHIRCKKLKDNGGEVEADYKNIREEE